MKKLLFSLATASLLGAGIMAFSPKGTNDSVLQGKCTGPKHVSTFQCLSSNTNPCSDTTGCNSQQVE